MSVEAIPGFLERLLRFEDALRRAGVEVALSEGVESVRALRHLELLDRTQLREGLAALCIKTHVHRRTFDELFELYFPARWGSGEERPAEGEPSDPDELIRQLIEELMSGDEAAIRRLARAAVERFGRVRGADGTESYFSYRVFRAIDLPGLLRELLARMAGGEAHLTPLQERLWRDEFEARLRTFEEEVQAEIRRRAAERRGPEQVAERLIRPPLEEVDFFRLTAEEQAQLRAQIRPLARKLATRVAAKRRLGRDGRLDVRRTVRRSLSTGGVPFDPAFRPRRPHKPELFVLCDVSGSVAAFARFTLMLVHTLQGQFSKVRSFAFIDTVDEVTHLFEEEDFATAVQRMMREADLVWLDGHSDYGHSLERFHEAYARDITPRSTILILGDARTNYRRPNEWVLADLARRARHVWWLNPEPAVYWDTGDSVASRYARLVDGMVEVRNLRQLAEFVERLG